MFLILTKLNVNFFFQKMERKVAQKNAMYAQRKYCKQAYYTHTNHKTQMQIILPRS